MADKYGWYGAKRWIASVLIAANATHFIDSTWHEGEERTPHLLEQHYVNPPPLHYSQGTVTASAYSGIFFPSVDGSLTGYIG